VGVFLDEFRKTDLLVLDKIYVPLQNGIVDVGIVYVRIVKELSQDMGLEEIHKLLDWQLLADYGNLLFRQFTHEVLLCCHLLCESHRASVRHNWVFDFWHFFLL